MVYLLHFDRPYRHARHYLGFTTNLEQRLALHAKPDGNSHHRLMQVLYAAGIGFKLARTWKGDRTLERQLKRRKSSPDLCPLCRAARRLERAS
jgi:predicted GIY-YIG superfamily endonuclease